MTQTVFAARSGAVAAPTAGLHFTSELIAAIQARGVTVLKVLLHVGPGTFESVRCEDPREHQLEAEYCEIDSQVVESILLLVRVRHHVLERSLSI